MGSTLNMRIKALDAIIRLFCIKFAVKVVEFKSLAKLGRNVIDYYHQLVGGDKMSYGCKHGKVNQKNAPVY
jgi:hypothetical protein